MFIYLLRVPAGCCPLRCPFLYPSLAPSFDFFFLLLFLFFLAATKDTTLPPKSVLLIENAPAVRSGLVSLFPLPPFPFPFPLSLVFFVSCVVLDWVGTQVMQSSQDSLTVEDSDTQSLTASVTDYPIEHGRRYHKYHEGGMFLSATRWLVDHR